MLTKYFKICVQPQLSNSWAYVMSPSVPEHEALSKVIIQAIRAMMTRRAQDALRIIGQQWCAEHMPHVDANRSLLPFLVLLNVALREPARWPIVVLRYGQPNVDASFSAGEGAVKATEFRMQDFIITLNGDRVHIYTQDVINGQKEQYVRWLELFVACVHEIGHMFVAFLYLTHTRRFGMMCPSATRLAYMDDKPEAGFALEHLMFGGVLRRGEDGSGRAFGHMAGVPVLKTESGERGIHLHSLLRLANHKGPYLPLDLPLATYTPSTTTSNLLTPFPRAAFFPFYQDWWTTFHEDFADVARDTARLDLDPVLHPLLLVQRLKSPRWVVPLPLRRLCRGREVGV